MVKSGESIREREALCCRVMIAEINEGSFHRTSAMCPWAEDCGRVVLRIQGWFNDQTKSDPGEARASFDVQSDRATLCMAKSHRHAAAVLRQGSGLRPETRSVSRGM